MATYVMSDIHGEYDKFRAMLDAIEMKDTDKLYILGDMVDRGPRSVDLVRHIMMSTNMEAILGNHEDMLLYAVSNYGMTGSLATRMLEGTMTQRTYKGLRKLWYKDRSEAMCVLSYLQRLNLYKEVDVNGVRYLLVHAGIRDVNLQENSKDDFLWIRDEFIKNTEPFPYTVVFGHTPTQSFVEGVPSIYRGTNKIGIDCGASFEGGRLACLRLDDLKEYYL